VTKSRSDLDPNLPDQRINITDVSGTVDAFKGLPYPYAGPPLIDPCP
jgi:hypothetical protein